MKNFIKLVSAGVGAALSVIALTGVAASAATPQPATARTAVVNGGQVVTLPPLVTVAPRTAAQPKQAVVKALNTGVGIPSGGFWQSRPEAVFGRQSLILPAGAWLSTGQAAAALGVGSVQDSGWASGAASGYRVNQNGGGWSGGSGGWAMIQAPTSGLVNEILYVQWR